MKIKKIKGLFLLSAAVAVSLSLGNMSFADSSASADLNAQGNLQTKVILGVDSSQQSQQNVLAVNPTTAEIPANQVTPAEPQTPCKYKADVVVPLTETNSKEADKDKNIVPVLDLKGGVQTQEVKKETPLTVWLKQDRATGDWNGLRSKLEDNGVTVSGSYMLNNFMKGHGGGLIGNSKPSYQGLVNTSVELNTEKMHLYPGGRLFVLFQDINGKGLSEKYTGDYMYFNSYESARPGPQLSEYWYEQSLLSNKIKFKVGKQDANCEFQALDTGFQFINSGFNFIVNSSLPTYPNPAVGFVTTLQPTENIYLKYGLFDANGVGSQSGFNTVFHKNGALQHMGELGFTHSLKGYAGKYIVGTWHNNKSRDEFLSDDVLNSGVVAGTFQSTNGFYTEFDQKIFKEKPDNVDGQGLSLLGQFSWAPPNKNELTKYFGTALAYKGLIPKRDEDTFGVGINSAKFTKRLGNTKGESVLEVFYKIALTPWLSIQPDFQWINKPYNADKSAVVFGVRTNITF